MLPCLSYHATNLKYHTRFHANSLPSDPTDSFYIEVRLLIIQLSFHEEKVFFFYLNFSYTKDISYLLLSLSIYQEHLYIDDLTIFALIKNALMLVIFSALLFILRIDYIFSVSILDPKPKSSSAHNRLLL
jgi:hypothetical protein